MIPQKYRDYCEQLCANKLITWKKWTNFQTHTNNKEIGNLNVSIISKQIESAIKCLPSEISLGPDGFTDIKYFKN